MQLPSFLPQGDDVAADGARSVTRKLIALVLFPLVLCVATGSLGTCMQKDHDTRVRLSREGVHVVATVANLRDELRRTGTGSNRRTEHHYSAELRYGLAGVQDRTATLTLTQSEYAAMAIGGPLPIVVLPSDPSVFATERAVVEALGETEADIWGTAFGFGLCLSSFLSLLVAFAKPRRRAARFWLFRR